MAVAVALGLAPTTGGAAGQESRGAGRPLGSPGTETSVSRSAFLMGTRLDLRIEGPGTRARLLAVSEAASRRQGEILRSGEPLLPAGTPLTPGALSLIAGHGHDELELQLGGPERAHPPHIR